MGGSLEEEHLLMNNLRLLLIAACPAVLLHAPGALSQSESSPTIPALYTAAENVITSLERTLGTAVQRRDPDAFLSLFSLPERSRQGLRTWFEDVTTIAGAASRAELSFTLPVLAAQQDRIFGINGLLRVTLTGADTTVARELPLPSTCLIRTGDSWSIAEPDGEEFPEDGEVAVTSAFFVTRPSIGDQALAVRAVFTYRNEGEKPLERIPLYLRYALRFTEVTVAGHSARGAMSFGTLGGMPAARLDLQLDTPLPPGESREVTFAWTASFLRHQFGRKPLGFTPDRGFILWESGWYPHASTGMVMVPYRMDITVPSGFLALTSGTLTDRRSSSEGETFSFSGSTPGSPYLVWGRYRVDTEEIGGARVEIWTPASGEIEPEPMQACLAKVLDLYHRILPPAALTGHRIVAVTRYGGYGPIGNLLLQDTYFAPDAVTRAENVDLVAHELAHSWVNSIALPAGDLMLPLSEGIATYMGARAVEEILGPEEARTLWAGRQESYQRVFQRTVPPSELTESIQYADNVMFRAVTYDKSAFLLREMETLLGDESFLVSLRETLLDHRGGGFTFDDLVAAMSRAGGDRVTDLYRRWKDDVDLPDYVLLPEKDDSPSGPVVMVNEGAFSPVPVRIVGCNGSGQVVRQATFVPEVGERITLPFMLDETVVSIRIDPEMHILQKERRNDIYPDWLLPVAEREALHTLLQRFFQALREKDVETAATLLTGDRAMLNDTLRNRLLGFVAQGPHDITRTGEGNSFSTGAARAEVEVPVRYKNGGTERILLGRFTCVREDDGWKIVIFSM
jgi:hypothetical protein